MIALKVDYIGKTFENPQGNSSILQGVSFSLNKGEIIGIRGENGSGKTTLFNIIAGIEKASNGYVRRGESADKNLTLGVVFQNYNSTLLPWLTVKENICVPAQIVGLQKSEIDRKLTAVIERLGFQSLPLKNYPNQLSGGQRQKVAIARALIQEPEILLLDEPFSNLDFQTSIDLQDTIQQIHSYRNTAILVVSHNIDHLIYLADKVLVLSGHPASISNTFKIDLPRPRERNVLVSRQFEDLRNNILEFEYSVNQRNDVTT